MLLTTTKALLDRLGMATTEDRLDTAKAALQGVTHKVESDLRTELTRYTRVDYFSIPIKTTRPRNLLLNLSQGFVDSGEAFTITLASEDYVENATDTRVLDTTEYEIDFTNGTVNIHPLYYYAGRERISVAYTAGFAVGNTGVIDASAPDWLGEAAISGAAMFLNSENFSRQKTKNFKYDQHIANRLYTGIVNPHVRPRSRGLISDRTTATVV